MEDEETEAEREIMVEKLRERFAPIVIQEWERETEETELPRGIAADIFSDLVYDYDVKELASLTGETLTDRVKEALKRYIDSEESFMPVAAP